MNESWRESEKKWKEKWAFGSTGKRKYCGIIILIFDLFYGYRCNCVCVCHVRTGNSVISRYPVIRKKYIHGRKVFLAFFDGTNVEQNKVYHKEKHPDW